jgi:hypothetical protein
MADQAKEKIIIYLSVDMQTISTYFNSHDPAPIYKRQLSHHFEHYIMASVTGAKRYTAILYMLKCASDVDKQYAEPLMYAIRSHYSSRTDRRKSEFNRFKFRSWLLLAISLVMVAVCQGLIPNFLDVDNKVHTTIGHSIDIFSWVLLWRPIDVLLFSWNPHLKDILLLYKLSTAECIIIDK